MIGGWKREREAKVERAVWIIINRWRTVFFSGSVSGPLDDTAYKIAVRHIIGCMSHAALDMDPLAVFMSWSPLPKHDGF